MRAADDALVFAARVRDEDGDLEHVAHGRHRRGRDSLRLAGNVRLAGLLLRAGRFGACCRGLVGARVARYARVARPAADRGHGDFKHRTEARLGTLPGLVFLEPHLWAPALRQFFVYLVWDGLL